MISLSNDTTLRTEVIAPPKDISAKIGFYVTQLPCEAFPTHLQALDRTGHIVASLAIHLLPVHGKTTC